MSRCWTCGSQVPKTGFWHTCNICNQTKEIVKVRKTLETYEPSDLQAVIDFSGIDFGLSEQLSEITDAIESGFSEIASVIEWGFEELHWRVEQATGVLKSIDKTLKTPGQTQANEWRQIAEELRQRGVLDEAKEFFLKSRNTNPLDYRTYIGLGKTYLQLGEFDEAKIVWEKSLSHAPRSWRLDYRSYSYRLIGRAFFCQENYYQAATMLYQSIKFSPDYYLGYYNYAQYLALIGDKENSIQCVEHALHAEPALINLAITEENFKTLKEEIHDLSSRIMADEKLQKEIPDRRLWRQADMREKSIDKLIEAHKKIEKKLETQLNPDIVRREYESIGGNFTEWLWNIKEIRRKEIYNFRSEMDSIIKKERNLKSIHDIRGSQLFRLRTKILDGLHDREHFKGNKIEALLREKVIEDYEERERKRKEDQEIKKHTSRSIWVKFKDFLKNL